MLFCLGMCVYVCVVIWVGRDGYVGFEAGLVMLFWVVDVVIQT